MWQQNQQQQFMNMQNQGMNPNFQTIMMPQQAQMGNLMSQQNVQIPQLQQQQNQQQQQLQQQQLQQQQQQQQGFNVPFTQQLQMHSSQLQNWMPDANMLQALQAQGAGQYRITLRPEMTAQQQQQQQQQQNVQYFQAQNYGQYGQNPLILQGGPGGHPQQSFVIQAPVLVPNGVGMPQQTMIAQPKLGMYTVDVVNNEMLGAPVTLYQAGSIVGADAQRKKTRKRRPKDPLAPKPARYAWNFFFKEHYKQMRNINNSREHFDVQKAFTDIGANLGEKWKKLTADERAPYIKLAQEDKKRYEREMQEYMRNGSIRRTSSNSDSPSPQDASGRPPSSPVPNEKNVVDTETNSSPVKTSPSDVPSSSESPVVSKTVECTSESVSNVEKPLSNVQEDTDESPVSGNKRSSPHEYDSDSSLDDHIESMNPSKKQKTESAEPHPPGELELTADILVTDDDEMFIFTIQRTLKKIAKEKGVNLNIEVAANGEEALRKIVEQKNKYAVVTMDKEMDDINGIETIKRMREAGYDGCVVGISANDYASDFNAVGADQALMKGPSLGQSVYNMIVEKKHDSLEKTGRADVTSTQLHSENTPANLAKDCSPVKKAAIVQEIPSVKQES